MSEMTMNRVIHHAVRRDLTRVATALRELPEGDTRRAGDVRRAWDHLSDQLHHHHEGEDTWIWPMLEGFGVDRVLLDEMESEHRAMAEALTSATEAVHQAARTANRADADRAADAVAHAESVTGTHLDHEEHQVEPLLRPHLESEEWKQVERKLRSGGVTRAGTFFAWVQDGMTPEGREYLSATVPPPVTFVLSRVFGRSYRSGIAPVWR